MGFNKGPAAGGRGFSNKPPAWVMLPPEEWAARHGGKPVADLLCPGDDCHVALSHVHAASGRGFLVDPVTGVWDRDGGA